MPRWTRSSVEAVRDAIDMVDLVSARTELRKNGARSFMGICPFHEERSPSFSVEPVEKLYHCFGCQASGDAFTFVRETEGVDFKDAVELLAQRYGVELEVEDEDPQDAERRRTRERLMELLERTAAFYVRYLWDSDEAAKAREYLLERGLEEATLREFRVGYAPSAWDKVLMASRRAGFTERELLDSGLAQSKRGGGQIYDRFRGRITFPLCDQRGRVLGFGARSMAGGDERGPKYLNSPESDLFHKSRVLFGADLARAQAARAGRVIAVEGYTDVLALHQNGMRQSVGIMGTSLTEEQVGELVRMAPTVLLALDSDSAGQEAMLRASKVAVGRKLELRVVTLPSGRDPADFLAAPGGGAELTRLVDGSVPFVRFRVERALDRGDLRGPEGKDAVLAELRPVFAELPPSVLREDLMALVADRMGLDGTLVGQLLGRTGSAPRQGERAAVPVLATTADPGERHERTFLAFCIARPDLAPAVLTTLDVEGDLTGALTRRLAVHLRDHPGSPPPEEEAELVALHRQLTVRAGQLPGGDAAFEMERLRLDIARVDRDMARARRERTPDVTRLARRREELRAAYDEASEQQLESSRPRA